MIESYDRLQAAREDLAVLLGDLHGLSGQLEELATAVRRLEWQAVPELQPGFHKRLIDASGRLAATLQALVDGGVEQPPSLAFSAVAQLSALESDIAAVAAPAFAGDRFRAADNAGPGEALTRTLERVRRRLWSLISHLTVVKEWSLTRQFAASATGGAPESIQVTFG